MPRTGNRMFGRSGGQLPEGDPRLVLAWSGQGHRIVMGSRVRRTAARCPPGCLRAREGSRLSPGPASDRAGPALERGRCVAALLGSVPAAAAAVDTHARTIDQPGCDADRWSVWWGCGARDHVRGLGLGPESRSKVSAGVWLAPDLGRPMERCAVTGDRRRHVPAARLGTGVPPQAGRLGGVLTVVADEPDEPDDLPGVVGRLQRLCRAAGRDLPASPWLSLIWLRIVEDIPESEMARTVRSVDPRAVRI